MSIEGKGMDGFELSFHFFFRVWADVTVVHARFVASKRNAIAFSLPLESHDALFFRGCVHDGLLDEASWSQKVPKKILFFNTHWNKWCSIRRVVHSYVLNRLAEHPAFKQSQAASALPSSRSLCAAIGLMEQVLGKDEVVESGFWFDRKLASIDKCLSRELGERRSELDGYFSP